MTTLLAKKPTLPSLAEEFFETGNMFPKFFDVDFIKKEFKIPSVNIMENNADFKLELAAPGLDKKDFKIEFDNGYLTISAEKKEETKEEKKNYSRKEFSYDTFMRSFLLPENVLIDKIHAQYESGILKIMIPKKEVAMVKAKKEIKIV